MYGSKQDKFSDNQAITVTADSENSVFFGHGDAGPGTTKELVIQVTEEFSAAGAATLGITLRTDDDDAYPSPKDIELGTFAVDDLVDGFQIPVRALPHGLKDYGKLVYTVTDGPMLTGKMNAGIVLDRQTNGVM